MAENSLLMDKSTVTANCHNDIHDGNIFMNGRKVIFLDVDDICMSHPFNDIGMIVANFIDSSMTLRYIERAIHELLKGYGEYPTTNNFRMIIVFAIRKLYFTESYFLHVQTTKEIKGDLILEMRKRQDILMALLPNYL